MADKPHLAAAFICERVLQEKDEVLSPIRIIDTLYVNVPKELPEGVIAQIQITILLSFRKTQGPDMSSHKAILHLHTPSGPGKTSIPAMDFAFKPDEISGTNLILQVGLGVKEFGTFWIDVFVDDEKGEPMTRIPFRLLQREELLRVTH